MTLRYKILLGLFIFAFLEGAVLVIIDKRASFLDETVIAAIEKSKNLVKKDVSQLNQKNQDIVAPEVTGDSPVGKKEDEAIEVSQPVSQDQDIGSQINEKKVEHIMYFTSQAPFADWEDPRQQDGCEEAVSLMTVSWGRGESFTLKTAEEKIIAASDYELKNFGEFRDTSAADTLTRIIKGYFGYDQAVLKNKVSLNDIISELGKGNIIVAPMNGQLLKNPFYTPPGPIRHMIVIRSYDKKTNEFITNDPGTKHGENYRYKADLFYNAMRDYPSGYHEEILKEEKNIIVVSPLNSAE